MLPLTKHSIAFDIKLYDFNARYFALPICDFLCDIVFAKIKYTDNKLSIVTFSFNIFSSL